MSVLAILNTKGGATKSTTAVNIAGEMARRGHRVWLVDGDRQKTAELSIMNRNNSNEVPFIACSNLTDGKALRAQVLNQRGQYDYIIIDAGGRDSTALRAALMLADTVLIPVRPSPYDNWALDDMAMLVDEALGQRDGLVCYTMLAAAETRQDSTDNKEVASEVGRFAFLQHLEVSLGNRKAFPRAAGAGLAVTELPSKYRDAKAVSELTALVDVLF